MMNKHIFIIEGIDGSGKSTQIEYLSKRLKEMGKDIKQIKFPAYESDSSALVKMYLKGVLSKKKCCRLNVRGQE